MFKQQPNIAPQNRFQRRIHRFQRQNTLENQLDSQEGNSFFLKRVTRKVVHQISRNLIPVRFTAPQRSQHSVTDSHHFTQALTLAGSAPPPDIHLRSERTQQAAADAIQSLKNGQQRFDFNIPRLTSPALRIRTHPQRTDPPPLQISPAAAAQTS